MPEDSFSERPLFGGAISSNLFHRFMDASDIRQVPDHQEVFVDPTRDESLIFELLTYMHDVPDEGSAAWFLQDLCAEQEAEGFVLMEQSSVVPIPHLQHSNSFAIGTSAVGQMCISKGRQGREAQNVVKVYVGNIRLRGVGTDVLITGYEPIVINPLSETARAVGDGLTGSGGIVNMADVFKVAISSFKVHDWTLFAGGSGSGTSLC